MHAHDNESSTRTSNFNISRMLQFRDLNAMLNVGPVKLKHRFLRPKDSYQFKCFINESWIHYFSSKDLHLLATENP